MANATSVYLITGFLGSGKTTFLNRIIAAFPKNRKLMILMNEFGDVGLDGALVEENGLAMLEISKGSIFCVCVKTDFIKGLMDIAQHTRPDALIIEATGVANPSDLKRDLKLSIFQNQFQFREQFCILDAVNFEAVYDTFISVEKQIESATVFIINKTDEADAGTLHRIRQIVARHHPKPEFFETVFADIPMGKYFRDLIPHENLSRGAPTPVSAQELDAFIDRRLTDPGSAMTPPDRLLSRTFTWMGKDLGQFEAMIALIPPKMVRTKAIFNADGAIYLLNGVMGQFKIEKIGPKERMNARMNKVVFIGPPEAIQQMDGIDFAGALQDM